MKLDKLFLQKTYADNVGHRLERWSVQSHSPYRANFRCPLCGDSQKNKFKRRGYILERSGYLIFYCHNACGTIGFEKFLKDHHGDLYTMYKFDLFKDMRQSNNVIKIEDIEDDEEEEFIEDVQDKELSDVGLPGVLECDHAYNYVRDRLIPEERLDDIYYTDYFYHFINSHVPNKFPNHYLERLDRRIVLPMRDFDGRIFGFIGRAIDKDNQLRYITIKIDDSMPKLFGLDQVDRSQRVFVAEGPIDSLFIDNGIALAGTDGNPMSVFERKNDFVMVLDNQPRAPDVIKKYEKYIHLGYNVVVWPSYIKQKDINDMIMEGGYTIEQVNNIIRENTFSSALLRVKFSNWRKI